MITDIAADNEKLIARYCSFDPDRLQLNVTGAPNDFANDELTQINCVYFLRYAGTGNNKSLIKSRINVSYGESAGNRQQVWSIPAGQLPFHSSVYKQ